MIKFNIVFIGCVQFSTSALELLITNQDKWNIRVSGVVTKQASTINADFSSLKPLADAANIPCFLAKGNEQAEMAAWIKQQHPDVVYCFGWSYLLKKEVLEASRLGVIGYHPSLLPANKGRHPLIWALVLGLEETGSSFFFMDDEADNGDLIHQERLPILWEDDAASLYEKMTITALKQIEQFTHSLVCSDYKKIAQIGPSNNWRKRSKVDGLIDWRMSAVSIYNLVRGLTHPYVGAHFENNGREIKVWKCEVVSSENNNNWEPGRVISVEERMFIVKCGQDGIRILEHELEELPGVGMYL